MNGNSNFTFKQKSKQVEITNKQTKIKGNKVG